MLNALFPNPEKRIIPTLISLACTRLILFSWQFIGLLRATDFDYVTYGSTVRTRSIQAVLLLSVVFTLVYSIESIQNVVSSEYTQRLGETINVEPSYTLSIQRGGQQLLLSGLLDIGITQAVKNIVDKNKSITAINLESVGGQIYEGRALSNFITEKAFTTLVDGECSSACATAFIGGKQRIIVGNGKIGFHQYRLDTKKHPKAVPFHNLKKEQERDLKLFKRQGIKEDFLRQVFNQTSDGIWFPSHQILLESGVVHKVLRSSDVYKAETTLK